MSPSCACMPATLKLKSAACCRLAPPCNSVGLWPQSISQKSFYHFKILAANKGVPLNEVWELDIDNGVEWVAAPPMSSTRSSLTCNLITTSAGDKEIVVVGGLTAINTVEIFSVNSREWRAGELREIIKSHLGSLYV